MANPIPRIDTAEMASKIEGFLAGTPIDSPPDAPAGDGAPPGFDTSELETGASGTIPQPPAPVQPTPEVAQPAGDGAGVVAPPAASPAPPDPFDGFDPTNPLTTPGQMTAPPGASPDPQPAPVPDQTPGAVDTDTGQFDANRVFELVLGHAPTPDEIVQTVGLATTVAALDDDRRQLVDGILTGRIDPRALLAPPPTPAPTPTPAPAQRAFDPYTDDLDAAPDPTIEAERAALAREREFLEAQRAQWEAQQAQHAQQEAKRALDEFHAAHADWAPEELAALDARVSQSAVWGGIFASTGDAYAATAQTIQLEALNHPHFREKLMGAAATSPEPTAADVARATTAAALAGNGGGGSPSPGTGPSTPPRPDDPRLSAVGLPANFGAQQPVQPVMSALTQPAASPTVDLTNRNALQLEMARMIAEGNIPRQ